MDVTKIGQVELTNMTDHYFADSILLICLAKLYVSNHKPFWLLTLSTFKISTPSFFKHKFAHFSRDIKYLVCVIRQVYLFRHIHHHHSQALTKLVVTLKKTRSTPLTNRHIIIMHPKSWSTDIINTSNVLSSAYWDVCIYSFSLALCKKYNSLIAC